MNESHDNDSEELMAEKEIAVSNQPVWNVCQKIITNTCLNFYENTAHFFTGLRNLHEERET